MNFKENESTQKLNGSYYTPSWLANYVSKWILKSDARTVLEPSCEHFLTVPGYTLGCNSTKNFNDGYEQLIMKIDNEPFQGG